MWIEVDTHASKQGLKKQIKLKQNNRKAKTKATEN